MPQTSVRTPNKLQLPSRCIPPISVDGTGMHRPLMLRFLYPHSLTRTPNFRLHSEHCGGAQRSEGRSSYSFWQQVRAHSRERIESVMGTVAIMTLVRCDFGEWFASERPLEGLGRWFRSAVSCPTRDERITRQLPRAGPALDVTVP
jgi:hypothetical protein